MELRQGVWWEIPANEEFDAVDVTYSSIHVLLFRGRAELVIDTQYGSTRCMCSSELFIISWCKVADKNKSTKISKI